MTRPLPPIVFTAEDLAPTRTQVRRFELASEIRRRKDVELDRVRSSLPFRSIEAHGGTFLIHVVPVWDEHPPRLPRLRGFDLSAARSWDTTALWSQYVHRTDRLSDAELREYVNAAANMLVAKVRWEHD